jgi:hypothetical protein
MESLIKALNQIGGYAVSSFVAVGATLKDALEKADKAGYERGYADGIREAREELAAVKKQLFAIAGALASEPPPKPLNEIPPAPPLARAPRGSVAPAVLDVLRSSERGVSPREVADKANIPENSARGSLNKLSQEGKVEKRGQLWFLAPPPIEAARREIF